MGEPGGGANALPTGYKSTPQRRAGRDLSSHWQEPEGWRRLQLHQLLRRPDRSEVQPQRRIREYHRDHVTLAGFAGYRACWSPASEQQTLRERRKCGDTKHPLETAIQLTVENARSGKAAPCSNCLEKLSAPQLRYLHQLDPCPM